MTRSVLVARPRLSRFAPGDEKFIRGSKAPLNSSLVEFLTWFVKLCTRIGSLDRICSKIAARKFLHELHKLRNTLVDLRKLLLGLRKCVCVRERVHV